MGGAIGWGLDWWIGTKPIFFLVFLMIGIAAGIMNVFRSARRMNEAASDQTGGARPTGREPPAKDKI